MGSNTAAARFLRPTNITGNVYELNTTAGAAADNTTIARYAAGGGGGTSRRYRPTQTTTTNTAVPSVGTAAANDGWRDLNAENANEQITFDAGNWTIRLRYRRSGQALEVDQQTNTTVILYNGTSGAELGRATLVLTYTTTVQTASFTINPGSVVFAANDKIQIEVYVVTTVAGVPTAPAVATDLWMTINESDANSGAKLTPQTYAVNTKRTLTASPAMVGVPTVARRLTLFRTLAVTMIGVPTMVRKVGHILPTVTMVGVASMTRKTGKILPTTTMIGLASMTRKIGHILPTVTMLGVATLERRLSLFRSLSPTMVGVATLTRAATLHRTLEVTMVGLATLTVVKTFRRTLEAAMVGVASITRKISHILPTVTMTGVASIARKTGKTMAVSMLGVATLTRAVTLRRTLEATMTGIVSAFVKIPFARVPGGGAIGGNTYSKGRIVNRRGWL
jgi:hypothetical protein